MKGPYSVTSDNLYVLLLVKRGVKEKVTHLTTKDFYRGFVRQLFYLESNRKTSFTFVMKLSVWSWSVSPSRFIPMNPLKLQTKFHTESYPNHQHPNQSLPVISTVLVNPKYLNTTTQVSEPHIWHSTTKDDFSTI